MKKYIIIIVLILLSSFTYAETEAVINESEFLWVNLEWSILEDYGFTLDHMQQYYDVVFKDAALNVPDAFQADADALGVSLTDLNDLCLSSIAVEQTDGLNTMLYLELPEDLNETISDYLDGSDDTFVNALVMYWDFQCELFNFALTEDEMETLFSDLYKKGAVSIEFVDKLEGKIVFLEDEITPAGSIVPVIPAMEFRGLSNGLKYGDMIDNHKIEAVLKSSSEFDLDVYAKRVFAPFDVINPVVTMNGLPVVSHRMNNIVYFEGQLGSYKVHAFDQSFDSWASDALSKVVSMQWMGYSDEPVTEPEFAEIILNVFGHSLLVEDQLLTRERMALLLNNYLEYKSITLPFSDHNDIDSSCKDAVYALKGADILSGYPDNTYKPKANISRAELAAVLIKLE